MKMKLKLVAIILTFSMFSSLIAGGEKVLEQKASKFSTSTLMESGEPQAGVLTTINESFEGTSFPPQGWIKLNPDGGTGWTRLTAGTTPLPGWNGGTAVPASPSTGVGMAYCTWNTGGVNSNDQWLITPQISNVQSDYQLRFWMYKFSTYPDNVDIKISTSGANTSNFTINARTIQFASSDTGWNFYTINIGNLVVAGSNIFIAFRERVLDNFNEGDAILLDDVFVGQVSTGPGPATNPSPANNATNVNTTTIVSWNNPSGTTQIELYRGISPNNLDLQYSGTAVSMSSFGGLNYNQDYYWKVNTINSSGTTNGSVWTFKTKNSQSSALISLQQIGSINGDSLVFSIDANNFVDVGAVTLRIQFNPSVISFGRSLNLIRTGILSNSPSPGLLNIDYADLTPINLSSGKFLDLKFLYIGGVTTLEFLTAQCEIADVNGNIISASYNNGIVLTDVIDNENGSMAVDFSLSQNYPNPFNPRTIIKYDVPEAQFITIKLFDLLGREIMNLVNEKRDAGRHQIEVDGSDIPSGVYYYTLTAGSFSDTKKLILIK